MNHVKRSNKAERYDSQCILSLRSFSLRTKAIKLFSQGGFHGPLFPHVLLKPLLLC